MLFTCKTHITIGLKKMDVPHVKQINHRTGVTCYFCNKEADYTLFYSFSFYYVIRKSHENEPIVNFFNSHIPFRPDI